MSAKNLDKHNRWRKMCIRDSYKAQYSLDCENGIENAVLRKLETPEMLLEGKQLREQIYAAVMALPEKPVSYTHLDVYKRQEKAPQIYFGLGHRLGSVCFCDDAYLLQLYGCFHRRPL